MTTTRRGQYPATDFRQFSALLTVFLFLLRSLAAPRKLIVAAVAAGLLLAPLPAAFGHERLELAGQSGFSVLDAAGHGHSHDDDEASGNPAGNSHGDHDPADHSHQFAFLAVSVSHGILPLPDRWRSFRNGTPDQAAGFGIDRPPKRMMSL